MAALERDSAGYSILYVDDEPLACKYFARALSDEFQILTVTSAAEALTTLAQQSKKIDILVTDYRMPGQSGGDLLYEVAERYPNIVCILVTAYADRDVLLESVNSGIIFRILEKPLEFNRVRQVLQQAAHKVFQRQLKQQRLDAINEVLSFLAHELNTPLATILNYSQGVAQRLVQQPEAPQLSQILTASQAIQFNARFCLSLLNGCIHSVKHAADLSSLDHLILAGKIVETALESYPFVMKQRGWVSVTVEGDFQIAALPNCVVLVLASVLNNALRAVNNKENPDVHLIVKNQQGSEICIVDNGVGISPETMARLLTDPVTTHADSGGHGWGLIFCKRIMQSFGGDILLASTEGQGTQVTLIFPPINSKEITNG